MTVELIILFHSKFIENRSVIWQMHSGFFLSFPIKFLSKFSWDFQPFTQRILRWNEFPIHFDDLWTIWTVFENEKNAKKCLIALKINEKSKQTPLTRRVLFLFAKFFFVIERQMKENSSKTEEKMFENSKRNYQTWEKLIKSEKKIEGKFTKKRKIVLNRKNGCWKFIKINAIYSDIMWLNVMFALDKLWKLLSPSVHINYNRKFDVLRDNIRPSIEILKVKKNNQQKQLSIAFIHFGANLVVKTWKNFRYIIVRVCFFFSHRPKVNSYKTIFTFTFKMTEELREQIDFLKKK